MARARRVERNAQRYGHRHRLIRAHYAREVASGNAYCAEPICLEPTRWIPPDWPWDLAHGDTENDYRGPAHRRCNRAEAATRGNRTRHERAVTPDRARSTRHW